MINKKSIPIMKPDGCSQTWFDDQEEDFRLPIPAEFEFAYIDRTGDIVIEAPFKCAKEFAFGRAAACCYPVDTINGRWHLNIIPRFQEKWGLIDEQGSFVTAQEFHYIAPFQNDRHTVARHRNTSYLLDLEGRIVSTFKNIEASSAALRRVIARPCDGGGLNLYDYNGELVSDGSFEEIGNFGAGLAPAKSPLFQPTSTEALNSKLFGGNLYGYIDKDGTLAFPARYSFAESFNDGYAAVKFGSKWGLIDTSGKIVLQTEYDHVGRYDHESGLIPVRKNQDCGFVDINGNIKIGTRFAGIKHFNQGLAPASEDGLRWGYIDSQGEFVITPKFQLAYPFNGNRALVYCDVNTAGHEEKIDVKNPINLVIAARKSRDDCQFDEARKLFNKAIDLAPDSIAAKQASAFLRTDMPLLAVPPAAIKLYKEGIAMADSGNFKDAADKLKSCIETAPEFEFGYSALSNILFYLRRLDEAESTANQLLLINPNYVRGHERLLMIYTARDSDEMAEKTMTTMKELNPYFSSEFY